jgi:MFS family permease
MADPVEPRVSASALVITAAVIAIIGSVLMLVAIGFALGAMLLMPATSAALPPFARTLLLVVYGFVICLSIFGIVTGIGLLLLRNWARISAMAWAGVCVFTAAIGIPIGFFITLPNAPNVPEETMHVVRWFFLVIYGLPLMVGVWWLILFNRKAIREQFVRPTTLLDPTAPQKLRCPLPVSVLAWFLISSAVNVVIVPFLPISFPVILFGHQIPGAGGKIFLLLNCVLLIVAGAGLLKLKPWSYPLTIAFQLFWLVSGVVSMLSSNYDALMAPAITDMNNAMRLPQSFYSTSDFLRNIHRFMFIGFLIPIVIVAMLLYYRRRFLEAVPSSPSNS